MYNQSFSGDTATQTTGRVPVEITPDIYRNYLLDKAFGKDVSANIEEIKEYEKLLKSKIRLSEEPLLELASNVTTVEVLVAEQPVVPNNIMKKHIYNIYPAMLSEDYLALKNDIQNNGYDSKYPIWLFNGEILDGWNRQRVCDELKIVPTYATFNGTDEEAFWFVVRSNERRHLTPQQKACIAADAVHVIKKIRKQVEEGKAEKNRIAAINQHRGSVQKLTHPPVDKNSNRTDTKLALLFATNRTYINQAIKLKKENPEKFEKIKSGEETNGKINIKGLCTGDVEWYTPGMYIEKVRAVMGSIDVDPASCDFAQELINAEIYFTSETNGLDKSWNGNVYMNPPYARGKIVLFTNKLKEEIKSGNTKQAIIITNSDTDTSWYHNLMEMSDAACLTKGRIKFYNEKGEGEPLCGQTIFYIGKNVDKFIQHFSDVGIIIRKHELPEKTD